MAETIESKIKSGYKETEVGVIPDEWDVKIFGECFKHLRAYTFSRNQLNYVEKEDAVYNIHYGDIHSTFPRNLLDVKKDIDLVPIIINPELDTPELLKDGDLIMADASEDYKGIGQSIELINVGDKKIVSGTHTFPLRPIERFAPKYAGYIFSSYNTHKEIKRIATGISVYGISKSNIAKIQLPIPPFPEQKAIADCLSTWDNGIEKLSALIASKKEQKKGLMQQLLTGEERLLSKNGLSFSEVWNEVNMGDLGETFNGLTGKTKKDFGEGKPYVTYLNTFRQNKIDENTVFDYVKVGETENQSVLKYGDLIFTTSSETPNEVGMSSVILFHPKESLHLNSFCFGLRLKSLDQLHPNFAVYLLRGADFRREMYKLAQGSTRFNLSKSSFKKIIVKLPSLSEQISIAELLSTAGKEIDLLETKLEAFKIEKKGLMQVLLTGEKRLV